MPETLTGRSPEAQHLHQNSIVIDLHVDPILQQLLFDYNIAEEHQLDWQPHKRRGLFIFLRTIAKWKKLHRPFFNHIDIPRMLKGGYTCGAFGIHYWPKQSERGWQAIQNQLHYFHEIIQNHDRFILARKPEDIRTAFQQGKVAGFPGVEGVHCLGKGGKETKQQRLDRIEELFHKYSVRYLTLVHFSKNDAAVPCLGRGSNPNAGLTHFGKQLVEKMNAIGMLVDVAHVNNRGVLDACQISSKPVIVSHAGVKAIHDHPRNISDEALKAIADSGGLVGIIFASHFLSGSRTNPSSEIIFQHIDHIVQKVGDDHIGIGSDFDGWISSIPQDMNDAADLPLLTQRMLEKGYSEQRIKKILGENFLRVWEAVLRL